MSVVQGFRVNSLLWHRRMTHLHFRKMNFITKNGLVQGVPLKSFVVDDKCLPCKMGKQHRKSHMPKQLNTISSTFELLHMNLFGPVNVRSIGHKYYYLVIIDYFSRFSWVFFLETSSVITRQ